MAPGAAFRGRVFGPGLPGTGTEVMGQWQGAVLTLSSDALTLQVPASALQMEAAGFNVQQMRLSWHSAEGEFACFIDQPESRERFLSSAPAAIASKGGRVKRHQRSVETRFRAAFSLYSLLLVWPLILLAVFLLNTDRIAEWVAEKIPVQYEEKIGNMVLAQTRTQIRLIESGPAYDAVRAIGEKLTQGSPYSYQWFIAAGPEVNAFAAPGGVIVVYSGLIAQTSRAEELAGVLAHEVAHVEQRHSLKKLAKSAGLSVALALVLGDWSGSTVGAWVASLTELKFSRDAEIQADSEGVKRLVQAGIAPHYMVQFFTKLAQKEGNVSALTLLSSHPPSQERMDALQKQIELLPQRHYEPLRMDWERIRHSL